MNTEEIAKKAIPQDIIDKAKQVGLDMEDLLKACVDHSKEAARTWLEMWIKKLGG